MTLNANVFYTLVRQHLEDCHNLTEEHLRCSVTNELFNHATFHDLLECRPPTSESLVRAITYSFTQLCNHTESHQIIRHLAEIAYPPSTISTAPAEPVAKVSQPKKRLRKKRKKPLRESVPLRKTALGYSHFQNPKLKNLDRHTVQRLRGILSQVEKKYAHFRCDGCSICDLVFKTIEVTPCAKKHGGSPCNDLAMYPHASETYLTVAHATKKVVGYGVGFRNPLNVDNNLHSYCTEMDVGVEPNVPTEEENQHSVSYDYQAEALRKEERELTLRDQRRFENTKVWKLDAQSAWADFEFALHRFRKWKTWPGFRVPSWATHGSKVLYETLCISDALDGARRIAEKRRVDRKSVV